MSVVDRILSRWKRDLVELEKAAKAEEANAANLTNQISNIQNQIGVSQQEAARARAVISNSNTLLAVPSA